MRRELTPGPYALWIGLVFLTVAACHRPKAKPISAESGIPLESGAVAEAAASNARPSRTESIQGPCAWSTTSDSDFPNGKPQSGTSVGHTSVVFRVKLVGGFETAFKPRSKRGGRRYRGEIAAYRLARGLGLCNVPPAFARSFDAAAMDAALGGDGTPAGLLWQGEAIRGDDGRVPGAVIPWIKGLEMIPLESREWKGRWKTWLSPDHALADADRKLAKDISTLIVFDYLTSNWDRWSGGNIGIDHATQMLLFIDNDGAFFDPAPAAAIAAQAKNLERVHRFSRQFIDTLRKFEPTALQIAIGEETAGVPLLSPRVMVGVDDRRKKVIEHVDTLVAREGEASVYAFE